MGFQSQGEMPLRTAKQDRENNLRQVDWYQPDYLKLREQFLKYQGKHHLIIIQGTPDPDAISSALALQFLGNAFDIESTILCFTGVSHQENRALVKRLGIKLSIYEHSFDLTKYDFYSILDSQKYLTPIDKQLKEADVKFFAFIDHHRNDPQAVPLAMFVDVRDDAASTAAILCSYLQQAYPEGLDIGDPEQVILATALMHGLRTDTQRFLRVSLLEHQAATYIHPCVAYQTIEVIERKVLSPSMLEMLERALVNRNAVDNFIYSNVGYVRSLDRDGIPQAAELLLTREGTDTALVWGIVDEKIIDGSFRTRSELINPDEFLKGCLGVSPAGDYYGGGNTRDRGGFQIPLGFLSMFDNKDQVYSMANDIIERSFLDYIGKTFSRK